MVCFCVQLVLVEVLGHEFHVTLHATQTAADVCRMHGHVYAFDVSTTSPPREDDSNATTTNDDDARHRISIIALSCDTKKSRRSRSFVFLGRISQH